jgi:hypothetical protein
MFIIIVSYRSRGLQTFRREQLINMIDNVKFYFNKNNIEFKIVICEQNDNNKFNRGILLNIGFIESEKKFKFKKIYFHMNTDYNLNLSMDFPQELIDFEKGFLDLYRFPYPTLGGACLFDSESYLTCNGFPNDLCGWGGDDWAIYNRIVSKNIPIISGKTFNSGFIIDIEYKFNKDQSDNYHNMMLAKRNDSKTNGVNSCNYKIDGFGEFHDGNIIYHFICSF